MKTIPLHLHCKQQIFQKLRPATFQTILNFYQCPVYFYDLCGDILSNKIHIYDLIEYHQIKKNDFVKIEDGINIVLYDYTLNNFIPNPDLDGNESTENSVMNDDPFQFQFKGDFREFEKLKGNKYKMIFLITINEI